MSFPPSRLRGFCPDYDYWSQDWYHEAKSTEDKIYIRMLGLHPQDFYSSGFPVTSSKETFSMSFALQNARGNVVGALIYNFDIDQMAEILNSSTYERNGKLALLDENNVVVSQNDNRQLGETSSLSEKNPGCHGTKTKTGRCRGRSMDRPAAQLPDNRKGLEIGLLCPPVCYTYIY